MDREGRCLDAVGALGRQDVRAEQLSAPGLGDELDEPARVARGERPRNIFERNVETLTSYPALRAFASVSPTLATCGSVNTMAGIAELS